MVLRPGSKLFVYTDGVPEATNGDDIMFGLDRMVDVLNEEKGAKPEQILDNMRCAVDEFVQGAPQFDDLTVLCLEYKGPKWRGTGDGGLFTLRPLFTLGYHVPYVFQRSDPLPFLPTSVASAS